MSTKKLPDVYLQREPVIKNVEFLESRLEMDEHKIKEKKIKSLTRR